MKDKTFEQECAEGYFAFGTNRPFEQLPIAVNSLSSVRSEIHSSFL